MMTARGWMNQLKFVRMDVESVISQVREAEAMIDCSPRYLTPAIAEYRETAAVACHRARRAGDDAALVTALVQMMRACEAELYWWRYALRSVQR